MFRQRNFRCHQLRTYGCVITEKEMEMDYSKPHTIFVVDANVQVWFHSPSGDSSDSQIFDIHCGSREQAMIVAQQWSQRFDMPWHDPEFRNAWDTNGLSSHGQWTLGGNDDEWEGDF